MKKLQEKNCDIFSHCEPKFIGRQNEKGHVLYGDKLFEYIGLTDKKGNYFYVRLLGKDKDSNYAVSSKVVESSGYSYDVTTPLKLVVVFRDFNSEIFNYKLINDIIGIGFDSFDRRRRPSMEVVSSSTNLESIYREETGKDIGQWRGDVQLMSFELSLKYHFEYEACDNLPDLCTDITFAKFTELIADCSTMDALLERLHALNNS